MNNRLKIFIVALVTLSVLFVLDPAGPKFIHSFFIEKIYTVLRDYRFARDKIKRHDASNSLNEKSAARTKEYSFSNAQIVEAKNEILKVQQLKKFLKDKHQQMETKNSTDNYLYVGTNCLSKQGLQCW